MEQDIVDDLLKTPFARRSMEEKLLIARMDVPRPKLDKLKTTCTRNGKIITRNFNATAYDAKWLCGSQTRSKLFCWPCLLFQNPSDNSVWNKAGYEDLNHLSSAIKTHSATREHINNGMAHRTFGKTRIEDALDHACEVARSNHNLIVKKNREGMKTLIELVCFLGSHGLSFRGHDESVTSVNRGNYKDMCDFLASKDLSFSDFINATAVFSGTSAKIQNELVEIVGSVMLEQIAREVEQAEYVAVMIDETTDISRKSQLALTLRYCLKNGNVCGGPCCDNHVESQLEAKATKNFERLVKHHTRSQRGHWEQTANMYRDYLLQLSRQSENKTLNLFSTVYRKMSPLSRDPILELYGTIRNHLTSTSFTDDLDLVTDKFFRHLFPVAYHHAVVQADKDVDFHSDYKNCLIHTYDDLKPFGDIPQQLSNSLVGSVSAASVLLRVLREGADVLNKLDELGTENLQGSCKAALLKMNYCASCKRYNHNHAKPCAGLCKNVMRGCLMQYIGILNQDWYTFTEAILPLINAVRSADGIEAEIKGLDGKLSNAIMHAMENGPQLEVKVKKACGTPALMQNDNLAGSYESPLPTTLQHNKWILAPINEMLQFEMTIDKNKDLFLQLSTTLCDDEEYHNNDEDCWTGTHFADYTHEVVSTASQKYNPEVPYSSSNEQFPRDSRLQMLIDKLINLKNVATKAVSSNAFKSDPDKMLSDMAEGSGDSYRDYESPEDEEYGENGSGSGEGPRRGVDIINVPSGGNSNFTPEAGKTSDSNRISISSVLACTAILLAALVGTSRH